MLDVQVRPHREYLLAQSGDQTLFLALKVRPAAQAAGARPQLSVAFVVDTSGSMREVVTEPTERTGRTVVVEGREYEVVRGAKSKMEIVKEALNDIVSSHLLQPADRLALIKFDDRGQTLVPFTPATDQQRLSAAIDELESPFTGGTHMGAGMDEALRLLQYETGSRRLVVLTDGRTVDEDLVRQQTEWLVQAQIPVTAIGVGEEWNEDLLTDLTDRTQGKPFHVVADTANPQPPSLRASELPQAMLGELKQAASEVVTNMGLSVRTVRDVRLVRITRVFPTLNEADPATQPIPAGNAMTGDWTVFVLEMAVPARPAARMRLAQIGLTYDVPGAGYRGELRPIDLVVEFVNDEAMAAQVDPEVMNWVKQRNIDSLLKQATVEAGTDPAKAMRTLELAKRITVALGNGALTQVINNAQGELNRSKTISAGTVKTLKIGAKTQTLRMGDQGNLPSEEEIRRLTGV